MAAAGGLGRSCVRASPAAGGRTATAHHDRGGAVFVLRCRVRAGSIGIIEVGGRRVVVFVRLHRGMVVVVVPVLVPVLPVLVLVLLVLVLRVRVPRHAGARALETRPCPPAAPRFFGLLATN